MNEISFFVPGLPKPGGSKKGFFNPKLQRVIIVDASNNKDWRASVAQFGKDANAGQPLLRDTLEIEFHFTLPRPKYHLRSNGALKPNAPTWHTSMPDATKLTRSTEDALTGIIWADDALIARQVISKSYGEKPGCHITVRRLVETGSPAQPVPNQSQPQLF